MQVFLISLGLLIITFLLHVFMWQFYVPKRQTRTLLILFFGSVFFYFITCLFFPKSTFILKEIHDWISLGLFYIPMTLSYIITYSALEVNSPSLVVIQKIYESKGQGLGKDRLNYYTSDEVLMFPRVKDLLRDELVVYSEDRLVLTAKGERFAFVFKTFRRILNLGYGG